jgi:hypothetical protein
METAAYLYPWDVLGDPAAADLYAGLGLSHVVLAAAYHSTRAITPRHPSHRVMVAHRSAAYYPVGDRRPDVALRLEAATWLGVTDPFGEATAALRAAGIPVHAWAVFNHIDVPDDIPQTVVNAYGDRYPWALCPAQDPVIRFALGLAEDIAGLPAIDGVELEACGWFGLEHPSVHDRLSAHPIDGAAQYLLSLCFCHACQSALHAGGVDPAALRRQVRRLVDGELRGDRPAVTPAPTGPVGVAARIDDLLGTALAAAVAEVRLGIADRLRAEVSTRLRTLRPDLTVLLHASPYRHRTTAFTGLDPTRASATVDGLVVNCWNDVNPVTLSRPAGRVLASLLAVRGLARRPDDLLSQAAAAAAAGADGLRLYHAGLAGADDLDAIRTLTAALRGRERGDERRERVDR